jgi:hypothetical protein
MQVQVRKDSVSVSKAPLPRKRAAAAIVWQLVARQPEQVAIQPAVDAAASAVAAAAEVSIRT